MQKFKQRKCPTCGGRSEATSDNIYEYRSCHKRHVQTVERHKKGKTVESQNKTARSPLFR